VKGIAERVDSMTTSGYELVRGGSTPPYRTSRTPKITLSIATTISKFETMRSPSVLCRSASVGLLRSRHDGQQVAVYTVGGE
jgi:hypothetical protein